MKKKPVKIRDDFLEIDPSALDEEWVNQPKIAKVYADKLADAKQDLDSLKSQMEVLRAEFALSIREKPEDFELDKVTEKAIEETITVQEEVQNLNDAIRQAKHRVDVLNGAVNSIEHRKKALENLVQLWLASYFSEPRAPAGAGRKEAEEMQKRATRRRRRKRGEDGD